MIVSTFLKLNRLIKVTGLAVLCCLLIANVNATQKNSYSEPVKPGLSPTKTELNPSQIAIVITDPLSDFLSPDGVDWTLVANGVNKNKTTQHVEQLLAMARNNGIPVFLSPHYYFPSDHGWKFAGAYEKVSSPNGRLDQPSIFSKQGTIISNSYFNPEYKPYLFNGKSIIVSPHKVYSQEKNDLLLQLRKLKITQVLLVGMSANRCAQTHMYELLKYGFEITIIEAAPRVDPTPSGHSHMDSNTNFYTMRQRL